MSLPMALAIPEVVAQVLEYFRPQLPNDSVQIPHLFHKDTARATSIKRSTLYQVALTSRIMRDCALQILWSYMFGVAPLLELVLNLEYDGKTGTWSLQKSLCEGDLLRFDFFGKFIRSLVFTGIGEQFDLSIFSRIYEYKGREPLLPSLVSLSVPPRCHDYIEAFLHRRIQCLCIQRDPDVFVPYAPCRSYPYFESMLLLQSFRLDGYSPNGFDIDISEITSLTSLRVVSLRYLDLSGPSTRRVLEQLATLPHLRDLCIGDIPDTPAVSTTRLDQHLCSTRTLSRFPALKSLWLKASNRSLITTLRTAGEHTLENLYLKPSADEWGTTGPGDGDVISTLAVTQLRSLSTLQIDCWTTLEAAWLEPLFQVSGLRCLDMGISPCSSLTDDFIARMTVSWPRLEIIRLYSSERVSLSIGCLQTFAKNCPHLLSLSLDIDTRDLSSAVAGGPSLVTHPNLVVFSVSKRSSIYGDKYVNIVERYLRAIFPSLQLVYVEGRRWIIFEGMVKKEGWDFVFDHIHRRLNPALQYQWAQFHQPQRSLSQSTASCF